MGAAATLFLALAALVLGFGAWSLWQSLRGALHAGVAAEGLDALELTARRAQLEDEKTQLLRSLSDLAFDHEAGKISDDDHRALEAKLRARAKEVLRALDEDLDRERGEAEALVRAALEKEGLAP